MTIDVTHSVRQRQLFLVALVDDGGFNVVVGNVYIEGSPLTMDKTSDWRSLTMEVSSVAFIENGWCHPYFASDKNW